MKVILLQEVKGKGVEGDVIDVARGFANNYLLPQNIAILATKGNLKQLEMRRNNIAKREAVRTAEAEQLKAAIEAVRLSIEVRVGDEGVLFGSVTTQMISDALKAQFDIELDRKNIDLAAAIKTAGEHEAVASLHRDIKATIKMVVGDAAMLQAAAEAPAEEAEEEAAEEQAAELAIGILSHCRISDPVAETVFPNPLFAMRGGGSFV